MNTIAYVSNQTWVTFQYVFTLSVTISEDVKYHITQSYTSLNQRLIFCTISPTEVLLVFIFCYLIISSSDLIYFVQFVSYFFINIIMSMSLNAFLAFSVFKYLQNVYPEFVLPTTKRLTWVNEKMLKLAQRTMYNFSQFCLVLKWCLEM